MKDSPIIAGVDEAGRGPLAGPVVAAACVLPCPTLQIGEGRWQISFAHAQPVETQNFASSTSKPPSRCIIGDSKQMTADEREAAFVVLTQQCIWGTGIVEAETIDRIGILEATQAAMQQAVAMLAERVPPTYLLIDGRDTFWFDYPHSSIIRGDSLEPVISAASIIAKVTRDRLMIEADHQFPVYGFARHKGYGTPEHREAIAQCGPCCMHRNTFLK